ncbi:hypothetical protein Aasi_1345 [Candidatus Amoebophilus asiaticus 5a2]|uniref:DUF2797 domain-containing protein n=1 Tax=Amoebophilus asiaticus (strain 5a2) TaxID=452471 RepID=B3ETV0_AMOA5|nr:DUF2797 domain-containing protein [Candidatus Amoebophilus asiaticus]ACE06652.1 hypothetical protein Aasi_1345 [Candidatus Amoebophilus asiaticus 5a2]
MYILSGYSYHSSKGPYLQLDEIASQPTIRHYVPIWEAYISLNILTNKYCIGGFDLTIKRSIPCPNQQEIGSKSLCCSNCNQSIQFNPAFYRIAPSQLSQQQQSYNLQPHAVYLAYFGGNIIKVGIANQKRIYTRWLEQGARAAVVLQCLQDAYAARTLEEYINTTYNIPERITIKQKQQCLHMPYYFEDASIKLNACRKAIYANLSTLSMDNPIQNLQDAYFHKKQPFPLYQSPKESQRTIAGYGLGMVGEVLIYEQQGYCFIQPLKSLLGQVQVRLNEKEVPIPVNIQTQLNLFG